MKTNKENNGVFIIVLLGIGAILVLFFPNIYDFISSLSMPKIQEQKEEQKEEQEEVKEIDENVLEIIHYPLMRTSIYNSNTYYSLDKFTINDLSNNDILLNAFLDIYEGNMTPYESIGRCTNISKQFDKKYIELRIKNILNNKLNYTFDNFYVPEDLDTNYSGTWNYDSYNNRFVYVGLCNSSATNVTYYNLEELIKIEYNKDDDIDAYYYVGFAKVEGSNFTIYKDPQMTIELSKGTFTTKEALNDVYKSMNKNDKKIYKYTFKNNLCSYNEYCLYEGKWVNEF